MLFSIVDRQCISLSIFPGPVFVRYTLLTLRFSLCFGIGFSFDFEDITFDACMCI